MYKQYLKQSFKITAIALFIMAVINTVVDPGQIYVKKLLHEHRAGELAEAVITSEHGVVLEGWNDRLVKISLAERAGDFDCVVLGSSHVMEISDVRNTGNINNQCSSLLNLGVLGGSLEDIAIISYIILTHEKKPKKIFLGIDPWTLKFDMDSRYGLYRGLLKDMNVELDEKGLGGMSYFAAIVKNIINGEYFYSSILAIIDGSWSHGLFSSLDIGVPDQMYSYEEGYREPLTLPDGSHLYSHDWMEWQREHLRAIKVGSGNYKIFPPVYDERAVGYLSHIIEHYREESIDIRLMMMPYHPKVFVIEAKAIHHMRVMDKVVKEFSQKRDIKLYGSFFPDRLGCKEDEFHDVMHASNACLNRIDFGS